MFKLMTTFARIKMAKLKSNILDSKMTLKEELLKQFTDYKGSFPVPPTSKIAFIQTKHI